MSFICQLSDQLLSMENSWVQDLTGVLPSPIKVASSKTASIVAIDDAIWIEHWYYFEDVVIKKNICLDLAESC